MSSQSSTRPSVFDSPWYWVYLFSAFGLGLLILNAGRYQQRQAQIESSGLRRQAAAMQARGQPSESSGAAEFAPAALPETARPLAIPLGPLLGLLGLLVAFSGWGLVRQLARRRRAHATDSAGAVPPNS